MKLRTFTIAQVTLAVAALTLGMNTALAANSDGRGHIWTPQGVYDKMGTTAKLFADRKQGSLEMGNGCFVSGSLTQAGKGKPLYILKVGEQDGMACPDVKEYSITILDGPAIRAVGNASKIRIQHRVQQGQADFSGVYTFESED